MDGETHEHEWDTENESDVTYTPPPEFDKPKVIRACCEMVGPPGARVHCSAFLIDDVVYEPRATLGGEAEKLRQLLHDVAMESGHGQEKLSDKTYGRVLDALHDFPPLVEHPETGEREALLRRLDNALLDGPGGEAEAVLLYAAREIERLSPNDPTPSCLRVLSEVLVNERSASPNPDYR